MIALLVLVVIVIIATIDVNQYKGQVIELVENNTHRDFDIAGEMNLAISLIPTIVVEGVSFGNADWGSQDSMMTMQRLELEVSLIPLLKRTLQVNKLILLSPDILLETNAEGKGNWALDLGKTEPEEPAGELPTIVINQIVIDDARLTYKDGMTGKVTEVTVDEIRLAGSGFGDPIELAITAAYNNIPITLQGSLGSPKQVFDNENLPVSLAGALSGAEFSVNGEIAHPMEARGLDLTVSFKVDSLHTLSQLAETELPEFGPVDFRGTLMDIEGGYSVKGLSLNAGPSDLSGEISVITSTERPALTALLKSNLIDLSGMAGEEEAKQQAAKDPNAKIFSSDPLPLDGLKAADVDVSIEATRIITDFVTLENTTLGLKLNNGKLVLTPMTSTAAGGSLSSNITLDGSSGKSASLSTQVNIKNLQPELLPKLQGQVTGAKTDMNVRLSGSGQSVAAIMAGLNGKVLVQTGEGFIKSKESDKESSSTLLKTFRNLKPGAQGEEGTQLVCYVMNLDIKDGIIAVDKNIAAVTDQMNIIGSGVINLQTEELDLGVTPEARKGLGLNMSQLAELVRLKGTLANPEVGTDTKAALKAGLSAGAAVATGGLSILAQGLFDRTTADADPCATALGIKPAQSAAAEPAQQETEESTSSGPIDAVKDTGTAIKDKLKGLFGR